MSNFVSFSSQGGRLINQFAGAFSSQNPRELYDFEFQVVASNISEVAPYIGLDVNYKIQSGQLPLNLTLNTTSGLISGTVIDLDEWVPEYQRPTGFAIAQDGSNYAAYGSAFAGSYSAEFTIRAYLVGYENAAFEDQDCSILVINNYSSDRDQFIRDYSEEYGNSFIVNGELVDANTYLEYQKSLGNFPILSNV